ncbi:hypothetical protein ACWD4T_00585 [Streptomyces umbrinus]
MADGSPDDDEDPPPPPPPAPAPAPPYPPLRYKWVTSMVPPEDADDESTTPATPEDYAVDLRFDLTEALSKETPRFEVDLGIFKSDYNSEYLTPTTHFEFTLDPPLFLERGARPDRQAPEDPPDRRTDPGYPSEFGAE